MNTTIYIFGNLPVFQAALTGLQMIFNPANNTDWAVGGSLFGVGPVVGIGLLISLLHVTTKGVWTQKMSLHHVGIMLGLYAAMFIPTTSVQVQDIYTGQTVIVDKIPIGVAYPAAIVSQLSYDAATQLGQAFQMATATAPTTDISQGFAEPLQQMLQMRRLYQNYVKTKPDLADSEFSFFQQCVYPVYSSNTTLQAAYNETNDILATVTNTNYVTSSGANMMVNVLGGPGNAICASPQGCVLTCNGLASTLQTQYNAWKTSSGSGSCTAAVAMAGAAKSDTVQPPSSCTTAASDLGNVLAQLGTNGDQYINQMVHGCMASAGMSAGGSLFAGTPSMSVLPSYCLITQNSLSQAQVDNAGAASMFLKNMLPLMSVLQFLFIAMAPLAAFTMVMAGAQGMGMFVKYIMFGLWTQSWLPVAAMLNDYSQITLAHTLGVLGQAVTGVSANITTAATSVTLASMPPPPANGLTLTTLPTVLEATMQALSNADMLLAMTPIITMIVFTGSYMGMAQLAQDMGGEDKVGKNAELETPSLGTQEKDFGVHAAGNPNYGGKYAASAAMDGIGINTTHALNSALGATVSSAAQHAQGANLELGLASMEAAAQTNSNATTRSGSSSTTVDGMQGSKVTGQHSAGVKTMDSTDHNTQFLANAAYALNLDALRSSPNAAKMTEAQMEGQAKQMTANMMENPDSLVATFAKAGKNGLAAVARGFKTGLNADTSGTVAEKASRDVGDMLTSSNEGGIVTKIAGSIGLDSKDQKALQDNKQVQDALKTAKTANDTYQHAEQVSTQANAVASAGVSQSLNGSQLRSVMEDAGHGSVYAGGKMLLAGTSPATQAMYESNYRQNVARGYSSDQASVTAYASTINAVQANPNGDGVTALSHLFSQPDTIGMNAALGSVVPMLESVSSDVNAMQDRTSLNPGEQQRLNKLKQQGNTLPGQVATGTRGAQAITPSTPDAVGQGGMNRARNFGQGAQQQTTQAYTAPTSEGAYQQKIDANPGLKQTQGNTNTVLANLSKGEFNHPNGALVGLVLANGAVSLLSDLSKALGGKKTPIAKDGGEPSAGDSNPGSEPVGSKGDPAGDPKVGSNPASNDVPGGGAEAKPTSAETPRQMTPDEVAQSKASMQARINAGQTVASPTTTPTGAAANQVAARDAARAAMGETVGSALPSAEGAVASQGAARQAARFATDAAAKEALGKAFTDAGAKMVAKTGTAQAVAEVAASTGTPVGDLVGMAIEGGVLVMNASTAADVLQTGGAIVAQYGPAKATEIMASAIGDGVESVVSNANAGAAAARNQMNSLIGGPPPTKP